MPGIDEVNYTELCNRSIELRHILRELEYDVFEYDSNLRSGDKKETENSYKHIMNIFEELDILFQDLKDFSKECMDSAVTDDPETLCQYVIDEDQDLDDDDDVERFGDFKIGTKSLPPNSPLKKMVSSPNKNKVASPKKGEVVRSPNRIVIPGSPSKPVKHRLVAK